jgi:hypothetical protein
MGRRRAWRLEDDERLRQLAVAGYSRHAIALKLGRRDSSVDARAREIKIPLATRARRNPKPQRLQDNCKRASLLVPEARGSEATLEIKACIDTIQRQLEKVDDLARELAWVEMRAILSHDIDQERLSSQGVVERRGRLCRARDRMVSSRCIFGFNDKDRKPVVS